MFALIALLIFSSPPEPEVVRIQSHLQRVESELRASGDGELDPAQRRWRAQLLDELHRYWTRGRFPKNTFTPRRSPVFVDRDGTRCAVAQLIDASGRGDLVARMAAGNNTAYLAELVDDPELVGWLDEHGLTAAEAARIQPSYQPRETGAYCYGDGECAAGECLQVDEQLAYCSSPCDEEAPCPVGYGDVPMECAARDDGASACVYPVPAPGSIGWPCGGDSEGPCYGACLTGEREPTCTYYCASKSDCPDGYACRERHDVAARVCVARRDGRGCALGAETGGPAAALLGLVVLWLRGRRPGPGRSRCRPPS